MQVKDIALFLLADAPCDGAIATAKRLASPAGAVSGVCLFSEPDLPLADGYAIGEVAVLEVLERRDKAVRAKVEAVGAAFRDRLTDLGEAAAWLAVDANEPADLTALRARFADLVVLARPEPHRPHQLAIAGNLILASGAPCVVAPPAAPDHGKFGRVLVAWDASANAKRALDAAMDFVTAADVVEVLIVEEHKRTLEMEWSDTLLSHLGRHGAQAKLDRRHGRPGEVGRLILEACGRFPADLLVMGAYAHGSGAERIFGGATRTVLTHAEI